MVLLLDNFDSFTYNLVDYFNQLGVQCRVVRNDIPIDQVANEQYEGVVISPGPETPSRSGGLMKFLDYYHDKLPMLGICLGHQAIGEYFGAELVKSDKPMHGKVSEIQLEKNCLFNNIPETINVVRYNSLVLQNVVPPLKIIATTQDNEVMAVSHHLLPIWGVQYHPEAAITEYGLALLKNWLEENGIVVNQ